MAHRRLGVRPARPRRRRRRLRAVGGLGLQPRGERLHALDAVQEAAALRRRALQVRLDALQAAALRGGGARVRPPAQLHRRAAEADRRSGRRLPQEAYTYIAGSLDNFDFAGPGPDEPYIARPDILDTARSPAEARGEAPRRDRPRAGPALIPQDKPWTIEIYKALALEFRSHQPVQERARDLPDDARQVADGSVGAGRRRTRSPRSTTCS